MARYIDADALESIVQSLNEDGLEITRHEYKIIDRVIFEFPTVDIAERKHGEWIKAKGSLWDLAHCSVCGKLVVGVDDANYCPNCGADMRKETEDEET